MLLTSTLGSLFYLFDSLTRSLPWGLYFTYFIPGPDHYPEVSILPVWLPDQVLASTLESLFYLFGSRTSPLPWGLYFTRYIPGQVLLSSNLESLFYMFDSLTRPIPWGLYFTRLIPRPGHYLGALFYPLDSRSGFAQFYPEVCILPVWFSDQTNTLESLFYSFDSQTRPIPWSLYFTRLIPGPGVGY